MFRLIWRFVRVLFAIVLLIAIIPVAGLAYGILTTGPLPNTPLAGVPENAPAPRIQERLASEIPGYKRPEDSTWLTYPEWAIVYAAREYATHVATNSPSSFPYWSYIGRFWQDYAIVIRAAEQYPFNTANHVMLTVIGTSHTIENAIQSIYENTVGRTTRIVAGAPVEEDRYQADVAAEYAAFLDQIPWYRFDNKSKRAGLWNIEPARGAGAVRSWERKLAFGLSYSVKQVYAKIIRTGLQASSDPALLDIHVWATGPVADAIAGEAGTRIEMNLADDGAVFVTPRYQVFTEMVPRLISRGIRFVEIGGNDEIMATMLSDGLMTPPEGSQLLFAYPLPADPKVWRTGLTLAVRRLHTVLPELEKSGGRLEHLYDY